MKLHHSNSNVGGCFFDTAGATVPRYTKSQHYCRKPAYAVVGMSVLLLSRHQAKMPLHLRPRACVLMCRRGSSEGSLADRRRRGEPPIYSIFLAASSLLMFIWIFFVPGSVWTGTLPHDAYLRASFEDVSVAPVSLLLKYNVMGQLAGLSHALPGAVWAMLAITQVNPYIRTAAGGELHKQGGRAMLFAAASLMLGYTLIDANNLHAEVVDFEHHGGHVAETIDSLNESSLAGILPPFNVFALRLLALWFMFSGLQTWLAINNSNPDVVAHRRWALRHIAAGLWVAGQRFFFILVRMVEDATLSPDLAKSPGAMGEAFYYSGYVMVAFYIAFTEWIIKSHEHNGK